MKANIQNWKNYCLYGIHFSEDYWHVKIYVYCMNGSDKGAFYELLFKDCNMESVDVKGSLLDLQIVEFNQHCNISGGYDIIISFSEDNKKLLKLSCSDYEITKSGKPWG